MTDAVSAGTSSTTVDDVVEALYGAHAGRLIGLAATLTPSHRHDAEAVVNEAFARCLVRWRRRGVPADPAAYLRRAVVNQSWATHRRRAIASRARRAAPSSEPGADVGVVADEAHRRLLEAVDALPRRQRECVVLRYLEEQSTAETAVILGISGGSVKTHLSRALGSLGLDLEEHP